MAHPQDKVICRIAYGLLTFAALWLYGAAWAYSRAQEKLETWERTEGEVIELVQERRSGRHGGTVWHPRFSFTAVDGKCYSVKDACGDDPPAYKLGAKVPVLYSREEPEDAVIHSWHGLYGLCLACSIFGVGFGFLGAVFYWGAHYEPKVYKAPR